MNFIFHLQVFVDVFGVCSVSSGLPMLWTAPGKNAPFVFPWHSLLEPRTMSSGEETLNNCWLSERTNLIWDILKIILFLYGHILFSLKSLIMWKYMWMCNLKHTWGEEKKKESLLGQNTLPRGYLPAFDHLGQSYIDFCGNVGSYCVAIYSKIWRDLFNSELCEDDTRKMLSWKSYTLLDCYFLHKDPLVLISTSGSSH